MTKRHKQWMTTILIFLLLTPLAIYAQEPTASGGFKDVEGHWAADTIMKWVERGWVKGQTEERFNPSASITRAEMAALVNKAIGYEEEWPWGFFDVDPGKWYASEVAKAVTAGYMSGDTTARFYPEAPVTRQQMAVMVGRLLLLEWEEPSASYSDLIDAPSWSSGSIGAVIREGVMSGTKPGLFEPMANLSRAEAVVTLERVLAHGIPVREKPPVPPEPEPMTNVEGEVTLQGKLSGRSLRMDIYPDREKSPELAEVLGTGVYVYNGKFRLDLPKGHYIIDTYHVDRTAVRLPEKIAFEVTDKTPTVTFALSLPNFSGMLYEENGKTPLSGARIEFSPVSASGRVEWGGVYTTSWEGRVATFLPDGKYKAKLVYLGDEREVLAFEDMVVENGVLQDNPFAAWRLPSEVTIHVKGGWTIGTDTFKVMIVPAGPRQRGAFYSVTDGQLKIHMKPGDYQILAYKVGVGPKQILGAPEQVLGTPIRFSVPGTITVHVG